MKVVRAMWGDEKAETLLRKHYSDVDEYIIDAANLDTQFDDPFPEGVGAWEVYLIRKRDRKLMFRGKISMLRRPEEGIEEWRLELKRVEEKAEETNWVKERERSEVRLTKAFERWLAKQPRERLEEIVRSIWKTHSLRLWLLPYQEILEEVKNEHD